METSKIKEAVQFMSQFIFNWAEESLFINKLYQFQIYHKIFWV